jgi:hypothetical protein
MDLSYKPVVLYQASLARMEESHRAFEARDPVLSAYLAGLAVECILQALALHDGAASDARHDLGRWLAKCPTRFQGVIEDTASSDWSLLFSLWDNGIRYLSDSGFLGYIREKKANRGISGTPDDVIREVARRMKDSADIIHKRGITQWKISTKKSS